MFKVAVSFALLALMATGIHANLKVSTNIRVVNPGTILKQNGEKMVVAGSNLPDDDGFSNWGDLIYKSRQDQDELLLRDIVIYPDASSNDQTLRYTASFGSVRSITSVRLLNVGRERAYGYQIDLSGSDVEITYVLPAERDPRVIIEVYGYSS